jgi:hypothetical protein
MINGVFKNRIIKNHNDRLNKHKSMDEDSHY